MSKLRWSPFFQFIGMVLIVLLFFCGIGALFIYSSQEYKKIVRAETQDAEKIISEYQPTHLGNGVYRFDPELRGRITRFATFGELLAKFLEKSQGLRVTAISQDGTIGEGENLKIIVVTEPKE